MAEFTNPELYVDFFMLDRSMFETAHELSEIDSDAFKIAHASIKRTTEILSFSDYREVEALEIGIKLYEALPQSHTAGEVSHSAIWSVIQSPRSYVDFNLDFVEFLEKSADSMSRKEPELAEATAKLVSVYLSDNSPHLAHIGQGGAGLMIDTFNEAQLAAEINTLE